MKPIKSRLSCHLQFRIYLTKMYRIFLFLLIAACTSNSSLKDMPDWYVYQKENDEKNFYGTGAGATKQEALLAALKNLASKISVSISSETVMVSEQKNLKLSEEMKESVREVVRDISFNNYQVTNSKRVGGKFYTEISVNKVDFLNAQKQLYTKLHDRLKKLREDFLYSDSPIEKHKIVTEILAANSDLQPLNQMLYSFGKISEAEFLKSAQHQKTYQDICDNFFNKSEIFVSFSNTPEEVQERVWAALSEEKKLKISKEKNSKNHNLLKLNFDSKLTASNAYGVHSIFLRVRTKLLSNENKEISNAVFDIETTSQKDKDDALKKASNQIAKLMKENGALKTLGISW